MCGALVACKRSDGCAAAARDGPLGLRRGQIEVPGSLTAGRLGEWCGGSPAPWLL